MADENTPHVQAKFFTKQSQYVFYLNVVFVFPETWKAFFFLNMH